MVVNLWVVTVFTVADAISVVGQTRKIYSECIGKMVILWLDNLRNFYILKFLRIAN